MRIFLTGGTGFIGKAVARKLLEEGHSLLLLTRHSPSELCQESAFYKKTKIIPESLANLQSWKTTLKQFEPEATVHFAWEGIPDYKSKMSTTNLEYGLNLYMTLAEIGCKRIVTSGSCWEYGRKTGELTENLVPLPNNPFTVAKNSLRLMGEQIAKEFNIQFIWMRFYYVYGPGQKSASLIPSIVESVMKDQVPQIKTPYAKNDFVFVDDVADATAMILKNCKEQNAIYNIGSGVSTSISDIAKIIYEKCKRTFPKDLQVVPNPNQQNVDFWANLIKIKKEIGWSPQTTIHDGIQKMLDSTS